jgi:hypothetical protein
LEYGFGVMARTGFQFEYSPTKYKAFIIELGTEMKSNFGLGYSTMVNTKIKTIYPMVYVSAKLANLFE